MYLCKKYKVTVYPQAIEMAATFDTNSLKQMADYSALEGRAIFNKATKENRAGQNDIPIMDDKGIPKKISRVLVCVGGSQPDAKSIASGKTIQGYIN